MNQQIDSAVPRSKPVTVVAIPESEHLVPGYGVMLIGHITKDTDGKRFVPTCWGTKLDPVKLKRDAEESIRKHWKDHHSGAALTRRFEPRTVGGHEVRFRHATGNSIVYTVYLRGGGKPVSTSAGLDGKCRTDPAWSLIPRTN